MKRSSTLLCGALLLLSATTAFGDTLVMQCNKANCVRLRCNGWGENCQPVEYFEHTKGRYVAAQSHQVCNEFGDCHFAPPSFPPSGATKAPAPATVPPTSTAVSPILIKVPK